MNIENMSNNKVVSLYFAMRDMFKKTPTFFELNSRMWKKEIRKIGSLRKFISFTLDELNHKNFDLFANNIINFQDELKDGMKKYELQLKNIYTILIEDYSKFKSLKNFNQDVYIYAINNSKDFSILEKDPDFFVSVVGSRKTPDIYKLWFKEILKKKLRNKIIISGLAYGADLMGHRIAMEAGSEIVVFHGFPIDYTPPLKKQDVYKYALNHGVVLSTVSPWERFFPGILQKRNKEMAWMSKESYVLYISGKSGTNGHISEMVKQSKSVYMPTDVYDSNKKFIEENTKIFGYSHKKMRYDG